MDDKRLKHVEAIVLSMTPKERPNPDLHQRVSGGSGSPRARAGRCRK